MGVALGLAIFVACLVTPPILILRSRVVSRGRKLAWASCSALSAFVPPAILTISGHRSISAQDIDSPFFVVGSLAMFALPWVFLFIYRAVYLKQP